MQQQKLKISIVIPCYNEAANIAKCLDAVSGLKIKPYEIIVVDNNSTDETAKIARSYKNVKLIKEKNQGLVAARNSGMNAARGDIIARIDADSRVREDWSETLTILFSDPNVQAVTGTGYFYDAPFKRLYHGLRNLFAVHFNRLILGHHMLWGTNMAIRNSCYKIVRSELCAKPNIMEDLDIAAHVYDNYGKTALRFSSKLWADISARRAMVNLKQNYLYLSMWPATLKAHGYVLTPLLWPAIAAALIGGVPVSASIRLYSEEQQRLIFNRNQWRKNQLYDRINP